MATTRTMTFTVKETGPDNSCQVVAEGHGFRIELMDPTDIKHAEEVARFLNSHVSALVTDRYA